MGQQRITHCVLDIALKLDDSAPREEGIEKISTFFMVVDINQTKRSLVSIKRSIEQRVLGEARMRWINREERPGAAEVKLP